MCPARECSTGIFYLPNRQEQWPDSHHAAPTKPSHLGRAGAVSLRRAQWSACMSSSVHRTYANQHDDRIAVGEGRTRSGR